MAEKLIMLKNLIKKSMKEEEVKEEECTNNLLKEIGEVDIKEGEDGISREERERREVLRMELANRLHMEEISWRQNPKEKWLKEKDRITKYFHCLASYRRCNYVDELMIDNSRS